MPHPVTLIALTLFVILLIILSSFFSSSETCMMALNRYRLRHLALEGNRTAKRVQKLLERPDRLLGVILIGNTFANILASSIATYVALHVFGGAGIAIVTILLTLIILIFAEIAPKTVAALYPQQMAFAYSIPLAVIMKMIYPIVWLANTLVNWLLSLVRIKVKKKSGVEALEPDELRTVVDESSSTMSEHSKEMLLGVLDLNKITVSDVMVPRNHVRGIDINLPIDKIILQLTSAEYTRFPVYRKNIDEMIGILKVKDALRLLSQKRFTKKALLRVLKAPYYIPEGTALGVQLHKFKGRSRRSALVVDEYGDIQGLVTMEDILEEIVGELDGDVAAVTQLVKAQEDGSYVIDGMANIRELNKFLNWDLPTTTAKTVSGLIIEKLQHVPKARHNFAIANYQFQVLSVERHRILKVKVLKQTTEAVNK